MSHIGTEELHRLYVGNTEITKAYLGSNLVFQNIYYAISSGIAPLTFQAKSGAIRSLIQYGKCEQRNLPPEYTQLEYIESSGTQYIDTGVLLSNTDVFEISFQSLNSLESPIMGAISSGTSYTSTNNLSVTYTVAGKGNLSDYSVYCDGAAGNANYAWNGGDRADGLKHTIKYNGLNIAPTLDDVPMEQIDTHILTENTPTVTTWLFGRNNTSTGTLSQAGVRIYDVYIQGKGHFIPAKNASNVIGMYDLVSGQFFTNQGTGNFIAGPDVVPTPDKPIDIWCNNGVLKARHQSGLPLGYTKIDYLQNDVNSYIYTNIGITADFKVLLDLYIPNSYSTAQSFIEGKTNINSFTIVGYNDSVLATRIGNQSTNGGIEYTLSTRGVIGLSTHGKKYMNSDTWEILERPISGTDTLKLFGNAIFRLYEAIIYDGDILLADFIPAKNSSNVIGLYDLVSKQFFTNDGTGDFIAGNEVSDPIEIYTEGTAETIDVHGKNLFDKNTSTFGYYYNPNGVYSKSAETMVSNWILISSNTTLTLAATIPAGGTIGANRRVNYFDANKNWLSQTVSQVSNNNPIYTFTTPENTKYIRISWPYNGTYALDTDHAQLELGSTATAYEPYLDNDLATATNLLQVGSYKDVQDIISGIVTRRVGILVLDGTENWNVITNNRGYYIPTNVIHAYYTNVIGLSNQFKFQLWDDNTRPMNTNSFSFNKESNTNTTKGNLTILPDLSIYSTVTLFQQYLADQYAAGTPVIVLYPLATETTESVTPQSLDTVKGTNIIDVTAEVSDIEMDVEHRV